MPVIVRCTCGRQLRVADEFVGKRVRCPLCGQTQTVTADSHIQPAMDEVPVMEEVFDDDGRIEIVEDEPPARRTADRRRAGSRLGRDQDDRYGRHRDIVKSGGTIWSSVWLWVSVGIAVVVLLTAGTVYVIWSAMSKVQQARTNVISNNNLMQMGLAAHDQAQTQNGSFLFTPDVRKDRTGKPLLSWRVALLPYIGEDGLYRQFRLDQPWDSPHNSGLINRMPKVYEHPGESGARPGETVYQVFTGGNTLFHEGNLPVFPRSFQRGTSNTILIVEAANPIVWTKPDDISFDPNGDPKTQLRWSAGDTCNVLMADGTVRQLRKSINPQTLRNAIMPQGNPNPGPDW
jgi:Protein of unknown function (DUF1559)